MPDLGYYPRNRLGRGGAKSPNRGEKSEHRPHQARLGPRFHALARREEVPGVVRPHAGPRSPWKALPCTRRPWQRVRPLREANFKMAGGRHPPPPHTVTSQWGPNCDAFLFETLAAVCNLIAATEGSRKVFVADEVQDLDLYFLPFDAEHQRLFPVLLFRLVQNVQAFETHIG